MTYLGELSFYLFFYLNAETQKKPYAWIELVLLFCVELMNVVYSNLFIIPPCKSVNCYAVPHSKELDVFIKRDQDTGFGFRVLGGEGSEQPVSPSYFCNHITKYLYTWTVFMWFISRSTLCLSSKMSYPFNFIRSTSVPSFPRGRRRRKAVWGPEMSS